MSLISNILRHSADRFGPFPCVVCLKEGSHSSTLTYNNAEHALKQHKRWIRNVIGDEESDLMVVAYLSWNSADMLLSLLACINCSGVLPALLNVRWTPNEMASALCTPKQVSTTAKTIILYGPGFGTVAKEVADLVSHDTRTMALPQVSQSFLTDIAKISNTETTTLRCDDWVKSTMRNEVVTDSRKDEEDAVIVFTSGTTSGAKGVRLSHKSLWIQAMAKLQSPCLYSQETRMLATTVPLFHVGGLSSALALLLAGGSWVFSPKALPGFDPLSVCASLSHPHLSVNTLVVVPAMLQSLLGQMQKDATNPSVRLILIGGQSASHGTLKRLYRIFPNARVVQTYACTEAASSLTFLDCRLHRDTNTTAPPGTPPADCVGIPPPHVDICIFHRDKDGGVPKRVEEPYQVGLIATRGPHVMNGYWTRGALKQETLSRNRWFLTNDLGFLDCSRRLFFCGRVKDVIRTGGETVLSSEVEQVLLRHGEIAECAVFALRDEKYGEAVSAAIVSQAPLAVDAVRKFCKGQGLAGYKRPRRVFFVKELPRNSSGKVLKRVLVERFAEHPFLQSKL